MERQPHSVLWCLAFNSPLVGQPCSKKLCIFSEIWRNFANYILHCHEWEPSHSQLPHKSALPEPLYLHSTPFSLAEDLDVDILTDDLGRVHDFIDGSIIIVPDIDYNHLRGVNSTLLAIHTLCHPLDKNEPIRWDDNEVTYNISPSKEIQSMATRYAI